MSGLSGSAVVRAGGCSILEWPRVGPFRRCRLRRHRDRYESGEKDHGNYNTAIDPFAVTTAYPNVIGTPRIVGSIDCWFYISSNRAWQSLAPNTADAFQFASRGQFGNAGINILRGPHATVFDFSLMRDFSIAERANLQFRWEVFNLTNTPMFSQPSSVLSSGSVGSITTLTGNPRVMQAALRFSF